MNTHLQQLQDDIIPHLPLALAVWVQPHHKRRSGLSYATVALVGNEGSMTLLRSVINPDPEVPFNRDVALNASCQSRSFGLSPKATSWSSTTATRISRSSTATSAPTLLSAAPNGISPNRLASLTSTTSSRLAASMTRSSGSASPAGNRRTRR